MEFAAIILAGGRGKRMGQDKAALLLEGEPLLLRQITSLRDLGFQEVVVALGRKRALPFHLDALAVEDSFQGMGPLAGIHAGLSAIRAPAALVVACDMPIFVPPLLWELLRLSGAEKIAICLRRGFIEPFPGIYPKSVLPFLTEALRLGKLKVQDFIWSAPHALLPEAKTKELDPEGLSFVNLNTEEEKERLCVG